MLLSRFWGVCSFLGVSKQMKASASLGVAVIFVMTIASAVASLLNDYVLTPFGLAFIQTIVFIFIDKLFLNFVVVIIIVVFQVFIRVIVHQAGD